MAWLSVACTVSVGFVYRLEQMVRGHFGLGLELGYRILRFDTVTAGNQTGSFLSPHGYTGANGSR